MAITNHEDLMIYDDRMLRHVRAVLEASLDGDDELTLAAIKAIDDELQIREEQRGRWLEQQEINFCDEAYRYDLTHYNSGFDD